MIFCLQNFPTLHIYSRKKKRQKANSFDKTRNIFITTHCNLKQFKFNLIWWQCGFIFPQDPLRSIYCNTSIIMSFIWTARIAVSLIHFVWILLTLHTR